jgi:hypothetical protein
VRLYADAAGESHFEDVSVGPRPVDFAPSAPPLNVGALGPASRCFFLGGPPGWPGEGRTL